ncbi:type IV secretion protein IcmC [Legionella sp. km772]|uniref:type IV secretion protein IcmC n=1 Tax=Legionella sp. km772 TaxID=2498111 RepID=UPI000F8ECCB9|nr:type IV secretion protein IcmC [Legionella sp. km772]RUR08569.1 type IV secretion protein IcmC [Legionella sp. km772]
MNIPDFVTMLGNVSQSLFPVQHLITGGAYLLGIIFFMSALRRFKAFGERSSQESSFVPLMYLMFGAALVYLPSAMSSLANTAFGVGNILTYTNYNQTSIYSVMGIIVRVAGLIWFVRGSVLVAHSSQPGMQEGPKGLLFIAAGVLSLNFDNTISMINTLVTNIVSWSINFKISQGY